MLVQKEVKNMYIGEYPGQRGVKNSESSKESESESKVDEETEKEVETK